TAVGKAIMAFLPEERVEDAVQKHGLRPLTRKTVSTLVELKARLEQIRKRGYAIDDEENEEGVCCVGAVVRGFEGEPVAAISVSGPTFRLGKENIAMIARSVIAAADGLSRQLGFVENNEVEDDKQSRLNQLQLANQ